MSSAQAKRGRSHFSGESLVTYEGRVAGRTVKTLLSPRSPREEIAPVDKRAGGPCMNDRRRVQVLLNAHAIAVWDEKPTIPAGRIDQPVRLASNGPTHKRPHNRIGRVVGARGFFSRYLHPATPLPCLP